MRTSGWTLLVPFLCALTTSQSGSAARIAIAPPELAPDSRYKSDILLVLAHPDDEVTITPWLAKVIFDGHKRVSVVYGTRGGAGGNRVGLEQGGALAEVREIEARRALAALTISNVWFLSGHDTPGQDVLHSLETWDHGESLGRMVRLMRLTRPEIVITLLPDSVIGENHDDHQAAGVLAVEAADQAGDPLAFPEQVTAPREHRHSDNYGEGLTLWQTKKLYFYDVDGVQEFRSRGPRFIATEISPSRKIPYSTFAENAWQYYETQNEFTSAQAHAAASTPVQLILGKTLVNAAVTDDCFQGITDVPIAFKALREVPAADVGRPSLELGGPWAFYQRFWRAHDLSLETLVAPEAQGLIGQKLWVPLVLSNNTETSAAVVLSTHLPRNWETDLPVRRLYQLGPHESRTVQDWVGIPQDTHASYEDLHWDIEENGETQSTTRLRVYVVTSSMPQ